MRTVLPEGRGECSACSCPRPICAGRAARWCPPRTGLDEVRCSARRCTVAEGVASPSTYTASSSCSPGDAASAVCECGGPAAHSSLPGRWTRPSRRRRRAPERPLPDTPALTREREPGSVGPHTRRRRRRDRGPAIAPTASRPAPTGARRSKARGVSPAATPARASPTRAIADREVQHGEHAVVERPERLDRAEVRLVARGDQGERLLGADDDREQGHDADGTHAAGDRPARPAAGEEAAHRPAEERGEPGAGQHERGDEHEGRRPVVRVIRKHLFAGGAVRGCRASAEDVLEHHEAAKASGARARRARPRSPQRWLVAGPRRSWSSRSVAVSMCGLQFARVCVQSSGTG